MKNQTRIAVVGPLPPVRSGIARHTGALCRALEERADVQIRAWSFSRLYPKLLYPGAAERDPDAEQPAGVDISSSIDGINPMSWTRTARDIRDWQPSILVMPAWTFFLAPSLAYIARRVRQDGCECCMIVHNASDHEQSAWKSLLSRLQLSQADRFVTHNDNLAEELTDQFPDVEVNVCPHPVFDDFPEPNGSRNRKAALELLFFGIVRPYKGLDIALQAVAKSGRSDIRLTIAGEFWEGLEETRRLIDQLGIANQIELHAHYIDDAEAAELFNMCDAVLLPYRSVTGSGVVATAYHYGRAVMASDLPGLSAVIEDGTTGWLFEPCDIDALAKLIDGLTRDATEVAGRAAQEYGKSLSWDSFAGIVVGGPAAQGNPKSD